MSANDQGSRSALCFFSDGGKKLVIRSGGEIEIESGGSVDVESGGAFKVAAVDITAGLAATSPRLYDHNTGITAFAGGGQASATALVGRFNDVTTVATAGDSVKLLTAALGQIQEVKNSGATALDVFPNTGDSINALAVDLAVRLPPGAHVAFRAISATVWETLETFISFAPTTVLGGFEIKGVDNAGNFIVTLSNAPHGQASVHSLPDPGGATGTVMELEPDQTVVGENTFTAPVVFDHDTTITAFATGGQANAVALTGQYNDVTVCATAGDSVKLLTAKLGHDQTVKNSGAATLAVFPNTDDTINALAANLSVDIPPGGELTFRATGAATWETIESLYLPAPTTQTGGLELKPADSAGNTTTTITNASQAAARTYTIPDAGASAAFMMTEGAQAVGGAQTLTPGAAAAAVALRLGASAAEGWEIRVIDEIVAQDAVSKDLTEDIPDGAVILSVQGNKETAGSAAGTTTNWAIGTVGNPDLYSPTVGGLTLDAKIDHIPDYAVNSGAVDIQVHSVTAAGAIGNTAAGGTSRVRIVYLALNSLDDA